MGVLDRQSIRDRAPNRRLGERALEQRQKLRQAAVDRRRPGRGAAAPQERSRPRTRARRSVSLIERLEGLLRGVIVALLLPLQLLSLLLRPSELMRRIRSAPDRIESHTRRLKLQSRDPETAAGRVRETARLSAHFLREEVADMQDGFPRLRDVVASALRLAERFLLRVASAVGLIDERGDADDARDRLFRGFALGLVAATGLLGLFMASYEAVETLKEHDRLALESVHVSGLHRVAEAEVLQQLDLPSGVNLLELPLPELEAAITDLPWVESARIERNLRDQTLHARIAERRAALVLGSGGLHLVDESGVVFKPLEVGDPSDLPVLTAPEEQVEVASRAALDALHALRSGTALKAADVSELQWRSPEGLTLVTRAGLPIRLGTQDYPDRLARLDRAVASGGLPLDALAEVDVALRDRIVAVPRVQPKARKQVAERIAKQPVKSTTRSLMLHLQRIGEGAEEDLFGGEAP